MRSVRACPRSYYIGGNAIDKIDCKHNNSERFSSAEIIIIVIIIIIIVISIVVIIIIQPINAPLRRSGCDSKKAPGANVSGVLAGPLREQAGMDALVLLSPVKQKAMKQVNCTSSHWRRLGPRFVLPSPPNVKFGGRRGTHCIREFQPARGDNGI